MTVLLLNYSLIVRWCFRVLDACSIYSHIRQCYIVFCWICSQICLPYKWHLQYTTCVMLHIIINIILLLLLPLCCCFVYLCLMFSLSIITAAETVGLPGKILLVVLAHTHTNFVYLEFWWHLFIIWFRSNLKAITCRFNTKFFLLFYYLFIYYYWNLFRTLKLNYKCRITNNEILRWRLQCYYILWEIN